MNWKLLRHAPWLDTRARFVASVRQGGNLLDLGSSDGETLRHMAELRPDVQFYACDLVGAPEKYPEGCNFQRANLEKDRLPWPDASMDAITCMHLIEHLSSLENVLNECARLLKPGGKVYFETPHPKTLAYPSPKGRSAGTFTLNFFDDVTHIRPVAVGGLAVSCRRSRLHVSHSGVSRNWLFAAAYPFLLFGPRNRKHYTAKIHWVGWSAFLIAEQSV